jgi:hypothetical protein
MTLTSLLGLTQRISVVGWAVFVATTAALLLLSGDAAGRGQDWVAFALIAAAAALSVTRMPHVLPPSRTGAVAVLCLAASTLPLWVPTQEYVSFAPWYLRAITEVAAWLVLRSRPVQAWIAAVLASGVLALLGQPVALVRQLATLLAVQILILALGWAVRTIAALRVEERLRVEQDSAREVAVTTRRTELAALAERAEPLLTKLATRTPSAALRRDAGLLEAALRDTLRGRRLAVEPMGSAALRARRRGIDVVLLDDLDEPWSSPSGIAWAADLLTDATESVTVRLGAGGLTFASGMSVLRYEHDGVASPLLSDRR